MRVSINCWATCVHVKHTCHTWLQKFFFPSKGVIKIQQNLPLCQSLGLNSFVCKYQERSRTLSILVVPGTPIGVPATRTTVPSD